VLTSIAIRVDPSIKAALKRRADHERRSLSFYVAEVIERHVIGHPAPGDAPTSVQQRSRVMSVPGGRLATVTTLIQEPVKRSLEGLANAERRSLSAYLSSVLQRHVT
jgi:predicted HicB family RNase H-like nuclease